MEEEPIVEEREEMMMSPTGGMPFKKTAHLLKPNAPAVEGGNLPLKLPYLSPKCKWPLEVSFQCWRLPPRKWEKWVGKMHFKYQSVWRQSGVHDAIMASIYSIHSNMELILNVAERWCSETNTFMFPWGEATVTLEDIMVLGGFSVLGGPVSLPLHGEELIMIEEILKNSINDLERLRTNSYCQWINLFMGSGDPFEHEAFLAMWLSRFVFPGKHRDQMNEDVFSIAVHLSRGTRIALAPAVLASIYRDLGLLKGTMSIASTLSNEGDGGILEVLTLWAPLQFVQIWTWERLVPLQPEPNFIDAGKPRVSRWHALKQEDTINIRPAIDSAGDMFLWRPYTLALDNWSLPSFYVQKEEWLPIEEGQTENEDFESFARFLRVCELQGIDCIEPYLPHRVALQFGYDQDLPKWISRSDTCSEMAWYGYSKPFNLNAFLFIPSRFSESDVTCRYMEWWRKRVLNPVDVMQGMVQKPRNARRAKKQITHTIQKEIKNEPDFSQGFHLTEKPVIVERQDSGLTRHSTDDYCRKDIGLLSVKVETEPGPEVPPSFVLKQVKTEPEAPPSFISKQNMADVPPGFPPKLKRTVENLGAHATTLLRCNKCPSIEARFSIDRKPLLEFQFSTSSPESIAAEVSRSPEPLEKAKETIMQSEGLTSNAYSESIQSGNSEQVTHRGEEMSSSSALQCPGLTLIEARVRRIESILAGIKDRTHG